MRKPQAMNVMVGSASRGGMRSVVDAYERDGFLEAQNIRVIYSYREGSFATRQIVLLRALLIYIWCLLTNRVALVHCHTAMWGSFWRKGLFASIARLFGIPVVLHLHGSEMKLFWAAQMPWVQRLIRRRLEKASQVIVLAQSWKAFIASIAPGANITVVPNYVATQLSAQRGEPSDDTILFLGLIGPRKGAFDLIRAFAVVRNLCPQARLLLGGNGQLAEAAALAAALHIADSVILLGWIDGPAKEALLRSAPIYVLPSHNEGLPMSVLEAMAAGAAVVTTRVGGLPELITDGIDGILIEPGDVDGLAAALLTLLNDAAMRARIADAGRRHVESHYSDSIVLPLLHHIYEKFQR